MAKAWETMVSDPESPKVSEDELTQHRLKTLEEIAVGARETERRVDTLTLSYANIERDIGEIAASVKALHARMDTIIRDDTFEQGRAEGREETSTKTWKIVGWTVMAVIAFGGLVVAILKLAIG